VKTGRFLYLYISSAVLFLSFADVSIGVSRNARSSAVTGYSWASHVVISGFSTSSAKSTKDEYIELYNPTSNVTDVSEWRVQTRGTDDKKKWVSRVVIPVGTKIPPYNFYLIANQDGYEGKKPDTAKKFQYGLLGEEGSIRLLDYDGQEVDKVGYGSDSVDYGGSPVENDGACLVRRNFGTDTGSNKADFVSSSERNEHNSYSLPEIPGSTVFPAASVNPSPAARTAESVAPGPDVEESKMYREAKSFWRSDKMFSCIGDLEKILQMDPNNSAAKKDLKEIPEKIKDELEQRALVGRDQYYGEAVVAYLEGNYNDAARNLQKILILTPDDYEVKDWFGKIMAMMSSKSQQPAAPPASEDEETIKPISPQTVKPPSHKIESETPAPKKPLAEVTKSDMEKADQFYAIGLKEYAAGYVSRAIDAWETCLKFNSGHEKAAAAIAKARKTQK